MIGGETAIVIHPVLKAGDQNYLRDIDDTLAEAVSLTRAINLEVVHAEAVALARPTPAQLFSKGHAERLGQMIEEMEPTIVIVNASLSPIQQRNLEKTWNAKVIDRTGLILEIFGARARTKEGRIQVDLAALEYQKSRLVKSWTHLERQRGGGGFMGGPGETQIEIDRRIIADRIAQLKREIESIRKTREVGKKARDKVPFPVVALVGYTNAGKSTLFNRLTKADVFAQDLLFATLDTTLRRLTLPSGQEIILSDTVGFISDLPTMLVAAFRATLEQVLEADVILHVRDISRHDSAAQRADVIDVLAELGITYAEDERIFEVLNKIDICDEDERADIMRDATRNEHLIPVSAVSGEGADGLLTTIDHFIARHRRVYDFTLPHSAGKAIAWLYENGEVIERIDGDENVRLMVHIESGNAEKFTSRFGFTPDDETNGEEA